MRTGWIVLLAVVSACGDDDCCKVADAATSDTSVPIDAPAPRRVEVASIAVTVNRDVDMLFVIDDSPSMLDKQARLINSFPTFVNVLALTPGGMPNIHLGVVSTDVGTKGAEDSTAAPMIGSGPGSCTGTGKGGNMQNPGTVVVGSYIIDVENPDTSRTHNYSGTLTDAFSSIAALGANGCGFEQPAHAAMLALLNNSVNAGFLRPTANLAIIVVTDEDDCSIAHSTLLTTDTSTLGPLQSFRCTRFGVTCDQGGATSDQMNIAGSKGGCHSNEASAYTLAMGSTASWFSMLKASPSQVMFAAIAAPPVPFDVELRTPPGGGAALPALSHSCTYSGAMGPEVGDPVVRLAQLANTFARSSMSDVCGDLSVGLTTIANQVRGMVGDTCLSRDIILPADCIVTDQSSSGTATLPECSASVTTNCYRLVSDAIACTSSPHLRVEIQRSTPPPADTVTSFQCFVP